MSKGPLRETCVKCFFELLCSNFLLLCLQPTAVRSALLLHQGSTTQKTASQDPKLIQSPHQKRNEKAHVYITTWKLIFIYLHCIYFSTPMCLHIDYVHVGILKLAGCGHGKCGKCAQKATRCAVNSNCAEDIQLKAVQIRRES